MQKLHITEDYKLDKFECPEQGIFDVRNPTVSRLSATHIMNRRRRIRTKGARGLNAIATISLAAEAGAEEFKLGSVVQVHREYTINLADNVIDTIKYMLPRTNAGGPVFTSNAR